MSANARHSAATPRWGTPEDIVERSRRVMEGISLDPCSEAQFQEVVKADTWYSLIDRGEDGLKLPWFGKMFVNPPGGLVQEFWDRLLSEDIEQAIWVGFSVEQFAILIDSAAHPLDFSCCIVRKRLKFRHHAKKDDPSMKDRPSHANYICGLGTNRLEFDKEFGPLGKIIHGPLVHPL